MRQWLAICIGDESDHYNKTNFWLTALITAIIIMISGPYVMRLSINLEYFQG